MYRMHEQFCTGKKQLFQSILGNIGSSSENVAVLAGHYMLAYDEKSKDLMPMIWQCAADQEQEDAFRAVTGNFPVYTFKLGLELIDELPGECNGKLVLLVNDHFFQYGFIGSNDEASRLRYDYYRCDPQVPHCYQEIVSEESRDLNEVILDNNDCNRAQSSLVPRESILFSEKWLRNKFTRQTFSLLLGDSHFFKGEKDNGDIWFSPFSCTRGSVSLMEEGSCGCSGEIIELLLEIHSRGYGNLVLFVPPECLGAVNQGVKAALHFLKENITVSVITLQNGTESKSASVVCDNTLYELCMHFWDCA